MDEKYNLIWNSFQATVAASLEAFRKERDFFDVTLVSEDQTAIEAHKVILSACSPLLKNILRMNNHQHPLIYLNGIESSYLKMVVDYIYMGEVQVPCDKINDFLNVAGMLQVAGLTNDILDPQESVKDDTQSRSEPILPKQTQTPELMKANDNPYKLMRSETQSSYGSNIRRGASRQSIRTHVGSQEELEKMVQDNLISNGDSSFSCRICEHAPSNRFRMTKHIETHCEGLLYTCERCSKVCDNREALRVHNYRCRIKQESLLL